MCWVMTSENVPVSHLQVGIAMDTATLMTQIEAHTVCCIVTEEFLQFAKSKGNDLMTPAPHFNFPGLKPGDSCVCAHEHGWTL